MRTSAAEKLPSDSAVSIQKNDMKRHAMRAYPEYRDTGILWLGLVPKCWEVNRLRFLASLVTDKADSREHPVGLENIESWTGQYIASDTEFDGLGVAFRAGDLLFGKLRPYLAKVLVPDFDGEAVGDFHVLRPAKDIVPRFMQYQMLTREFISVVDGSTYGTKMPRANWAFVGNVRCVKPSYVEQKAIVAFLDRETARIDNLIAEKQNFINLLKEKRQALISHVVTKGLDPKAKMKDSGIEWLGEVPEHWSVCRIKQVSSFITSGPRGWSDYLGEGDSIFLQSGDLNNDLGIELQDANRVNPPEGAEGIRTKLENGDVVVCITGANTGRVAIAKGVQEPVYINQHLSLIRCRSELVDSDFLGYFLTSDSGQQYYTVSQYGLKEGLSLRNVAETPVVLPPISEQEQIRTYLERIAHRFRSILEETASSVELLREHRTALISAAVTGKIDVRDH